MMKQMAKWAVSKNEHVRRLASEGCRPRLPWAIALPSFKKNPKPVIRVLEKLKNDESEYVRRSVANNLNDIAKDNPDVVIGIARKWLGKNPKTDWLVKHACRSLLKQGRPEVLELFGFDTPKGIQLTEFKVAPRASIGHALEFEFVLKTRKSELGRLRIEYSVEFVRLRGKSSTKMFKVSEGKYATKEKQVKKTHSFKLISTRRYYPGVHRLAVVVNGKELGGTEFELEK